MFFASSIMHMVLPYHRSDYKRLPAEEKVRAAIRVPFADHKKMKAPATQEKFKHGRWER